PLGVDTQGNAQNCTLAGSGGGGTAGPTAKSLAIDAPSTVDSNKYQLIWASAATIYRASCSTDQGTLSINFDLRAEATPNTAGINVLSAPLVCGATTQTACASGCSVSTISSGSVAAHAPV